MNLTIKFSKEKIHTYMLIIFILMMCRWMYLIPEAIFGVNTDDITLVFFILYYGFCYIKYHKKNEQGKSYKGPIYLALLICFVAAFKGNVNWEQSIMAGLLPQRYFFFILLSYLPIRNMIYLKKINVKSFLDAIIIVGIVASILYLIQHFTYPKLIFINTLMNQRNGLRIYVDSVVIELMIMIVFERLLYDKKNKFYHIMVLLLGLAHVFLVSQGRLESSAIIATLFIGFLLWNKVSLLKIWGSGVIFGAVLWVVNSGIIDTIIGTQNTLEIRFYGRSLYFEQLFSSISNLIFGCGYPNSLDASIASGSVNYIYLADNGIFAFFYVYGLLGLLFVFLFLIRAMGMSWRIYRVGGNILPLMFLIFNMILAYNITFWWWKLEWIFVLVIYLSYLEHQNYKNKVIRY
ncbi:hypothetical protein [Trichococcus pasteurii]|uniref:Uncharacterized protein n=1 Tax=Trichococcus pasteurii TaxID=43064 RepID=A0A1W1III4_9LACT|nr:hypothetical protein [Trichococcus pasteurii]SFF09143.1 hypothetical protein SAMN04488086_12611 [Trichococcus pasteurii]SLM52745.1 Hypothetical protein TPAS_2452 [Trichococcus pasteurii]SSB93626.1 Hypothetical protein TPAS_2452 [Trichococcus pasteurii]